jgi:pre-mRNA-processing factor 6
MTGKAKRAREARMANSRSYAVPDSVLAAAGRQGELDTSISSGDADGMTTNLASIGAAQLSALTVRLDSAANTGTQTTTTSGTATSVDPRGYMTALDKKQQLGEEVQVEGKSQLYELHVRHTLISYRHKPRESAARVRCELIDV